MIITAELVKELRERSGAGMMDCKRALVESNGDIEAAIEAMRKSGQAKASKKAGRIAAEGLVVVLAEGKKAVIVEVNCETDFVGKDESFKEFANEVAKVALAKKISDIDALLTSTMLHQPRAVEECRAELIAKVGENVAIRRVQFVETAANAAVYSHGGRIGVLVVHQNGDEALGRDIAMHIAASKPEFISTHEVPQSRLDKEKEILMAQTENTDKPKDIIEKMMVGRLKKFTDEICLEGQPFVKDPNTTVGKLLASKGVKVDAFYRFEVGEGIEKKVDNFVEEVMAQAKAATKS